MLRAYVEPKELDTESQQAIESTLFARQPDLRQKNQQPTIDSCFVYSLFHWMESAYISLAASAQACANVPLDNEVTDKFP